MEKGKDLQDDGRHPTDTVGEDDEEESDGDFDFIRCQRSGVTSPPDAQEQRRVHVDDHHDTACNMPNTIINRKQSISNR